MSQTSQTPENVLVQNIHDFARAAGETDRLLANTIQSTGELAIAAGRAAAEAKALALSMSGSGGVSDGKPWVVYADTAAEVDVATLPDGALIQTEEPVAGAVTSGAVEVEVGDTLSGGTSVVPSSYTVQKAIEAAGVGSTSAVTDSVARFYISTNGNDTNDGLTASTPVKTFSKIKNLISSEPKVSKTKIYVAGGDYSSGDYSSVDNEWKFENYGEINIQLQNTTTLPRLKVSGSFSKVAIQGADLTVANIEASDYGEFYFKGSNRFTVTSTNASVDSAAIVAINGGLVDIHAGNLSVNSTSAKTFRKAVSVWDNSKIKLDVSGGIAFDGTFNGHIIEVSRFSHFYVECSGTLSCSETLQRGALLYVTESSTAYLHGYHIQCGNIENGIARAGNGSKVVFDIYGTVTCTLRSDYAFEAEHFSYMYVSVGGTFTLGDNLRSSQGFFCARRGSCLRCHDNGNNFTLDANGKGNSQFAYCSDNSYLDSYGTFQMVGTANNLKRFLVQACSVIAVPGGSQTFFPGSTDGVVETSTFGVYKSR